MIENSRTKVFYKVNYVLVTLIVLTMLLPLLNIVATSFSSERAIMSNEVGIWPVSYTHLDVYKRQFQVHAECVFNQILAITGHGAATYAHALAAQRVNLL